MPGILIDSAPFRRRRDRSLCQLVQTLGAALDPDAVELEFCFHPTRQYYRRRFVAAQGEGARPVRKPRASAGSDLVLRAVFHVPELVDNGTLTLLRRVRRPWTGAERMRFDLLRPLITQVVEAAARSEVDSRARRWLLSAAERTDAPILLFDVDGTILFANVAADALLSHQTEEGLCVLADDRRSTPLLSHLLRLASLDPPVTQQRLALTNGRSLEARVTLVDGDGEDEDAPSVRIVTLREREALTIDDVRPHLHARGVSGREADVVAGVLSGRRNAEIASELFISEYTVKDHLKHVFHKLGVASRGGLLQALYAAPADSGGSRPTGIGPRRPDKVETTSP